MIKLIKIFIGSLFFSISTLAQQLPIYSQYMMNGFLLNPAVAGSDGYTSFNLTAREQWLGFENAPKTRSLSVQGRLLKRSYRIRRSGRGSRRFISSRSGRVGLGGVLYNDKNGLIDRTGLQFTYAYHIFIGNSQLSFGMSGSAFQLKINDEAFFLKQQDDPLNYSDLRKPVYVPDANFGMYYISPEYYAGISVKQLFQSPVKIGNQVFEEFKMYRHYYLTGGYRFFLNGGYELEPSVLLQYTEQMISQADLGLRLYYQDDYWFGTSVRTSGAFIAIAGFRLNRFYMGYSFDYTFSSIRKHSFGSHEIMIAFKMGDDARRYRWLNRY